MTRKKCNEISSDDPDFRRPPMSTLAKQRNYSVSEFETFDSRSV